MGSVWYQALYSDLCCGAVGIFIYSRYIWSRVEKVKSCCLYVGVWPELTDIVAMHLFLLFRSCCWLCSCVCSRWLHLIHRFLLTLGNGDLAGWHYRTPLWHVPNVHQHLPNSTVQILLLRFCSFLLPFFRFFSFPRQKEAVGANWISPTHSTTRVLIICVGLLIRQSLLCYTQNLSLSLSLCIFEWASKWIVFGGG